MSVSHNFFLQMFLETGVPGGLLVLAIFYGLWRQAGCPAARRRGLDVPAKAALLAAVAGGLGGEYFYGGIGLFTLLAVYAVGGSLAVRSPVTMARFVPRVEGSYADSTRPS